MLRKEIITNLKWILNQCPINDAIPTLFLDSLKSSYPRFYGGVIDKAHAQKSYVDWFLFIETRKA